MARRRSMAERARVLRAWQASGLSAARFSAANAVSIDSLFRWRRAATAAPRRRRATAPPTPELLPVQLVAAPARPAALEVVLRDGRRVRCGADVPPAHVAALVAALERGEC